MKNKLIVSLVIICMSIVTMGCGTKTKAKSGLQIANHVDFDTDDYENIVSPNNMLGFKILQEVEQDDDGNRFISPVSLMMALSMVYNGADGETQREIATALQVEGMDVDTLNKANASLMTMLDKDSEHIQLDVANSIWLNEMFNIQTDFAAKNKDYFNAGIQAVDVTDRQTPEVINDWVKKQTHGTIEKIVDDALDPNMVAMLINAIYFKGNWTHPFDEEATENRAYYLEDGSTIDVPLMHLTEELAYFETVDFQAVSLPYGDGEIRMNVFLPKEDVAFDEFQTLLTVENWDMWSNNFREKEGTIMLPRFKLEYKVNLIEPLMELGMIEAFDEKDANFSNVLEEDEDIFISKVLQKTFLDVNEEGTEAAAVTGIEMKLASAPANGPFYMEVNRPFFITITDNDTGTILFMGTIKQP